MEKYIYIPNLNKKGKIAISSKVLESIAEESIRSIPGVFTRKNEVTASKKTFKFHRPIETTINHGIVHVKVFVDIVKGVDIQEVSTLMQTRIKESFFQTVETIPFDVQVHTETII